MKDRQVAGTYREFAIGSVPLNPNVAFQLATRSCNPVMKIEHIWDYSG